MNAKQIFELGNDLFGKKTPILSFKPDDAIRAAERIERVLRDKDTLPERPADRETEAEPEQPTA